MKTPFRFDGHGVNDAEGQRICKVTSCEPYTYDSGKPERNKEFDALSNLFAAAPELLDALRQLQQAIHEAHLLDVKKQFRLCVADSAASAAIAKAESQQ